MSSRVYLSPKKRHRYAATVLSYTCSPPPDIAELCTLVVHQLVDFRSGRELVLEESIIGPEVRYAKPIMRMGRRRRGLVYTRTLFKDHVGIRSHTT